MKKAITSLLVFALLSGVAFAEEASSSLSFQTSIPEVNVNFEGALKTVTSFVMQNIGGFNVSDIMENKAVSEKIEEYQNKVSIPEPLKSILRFVFYLFGALLDVVKKILEFVASFLRLN